MPRKRGWRQRGASSSAENAEEGRIEVEGTDMVMARETVLLAQYSEGHMGPKFNDEHDRG